MPGDHAFDDDDALADHDAVALASMVRRREVSRQELAAAALTRAERITWLGAVAATGPTARGAVDGVLGGVPTYVKDNTDVRGMPTAEGSTSFRPLPALHHGLVTEQLLATGLSVLGKSRMPEFGFNASTEFDGAEPARNPWNPAFSAGASSGGAAVLVAAGVVPIAHANDGGGSIRIPAACCGLVGLKPGRGRMVPGPSNGRLPVDIVTEGVLTRSVRDTAHFLAAAERVHRNPALPPIGLVEGPTDRRLRIGLVLEPPVGTVTCRETVAAVLDVARALERMGHTVEPVQLPFDRTFAADVLDYWAMLAFLVISTGRWTHDRRFDPTRLDGLSRGLRDHYRRAMPRTPAILHRLRQVRRVVAHTFADHDLVLSPVLGHLPPRLGYLSPTVPFEELLRRLVAYAAFTPLSNIAGFPAIAVPAGLSTEGLPIGVQLAAGHGAERSLLEVAFALEQDRPFPRIVGLGSRDARTVLAL